MLRLRKIEKGNDNNVSLNVFFFFQIFILIPNLKKKMQNGVTLVGLTAAVIKL